MLPVEFYPGIGSREASENVAENILILITKNLCRRHFYLLPSFAQIPLLKVADFWLKT